MTARALISDFITAISAIVNIPVLAFDANEIRELPAVIVGYESAEKHPALANEEIKITVSILSNGHITADPASYLDTIFASLSTEDFNTPVQYAELTGTTTSETESATIHTATLTILT